MVRLAFAVACCALAVGTAAQAQISNVTGAATSNTTLSGISGGDVTGTGTASGTGGASNYASTFSITNKTISFESGNTTLGTSVGTTSVSRVDFDLTNNQDATLRNATLTSEITPAGMGMYLANVTGGCAANPQSCGQSAGTHTFFDLLPANADAGGPLASASFDFTVLQNGEQIYNLNGSLDLSYDGGVFLSNNTESAASQLNGFVTLNKFGALNSDGFSDGALGFAWDATDIEIGLNAIGGFSTTTLSYIVTVSSFSQAACLDGGSTCLVAYSGFGDPIGRGGDISSLSAPLSPFGAFSLSGFGASFGSLGGSNLIGGVNFTPQTLTTPELDQNGDVVLTQNGVPEPATWMSLILGFGLLGTALRRRRVLAYT